MRSSRNIYLFIGVTSLLILLIGAVAYSGVRSYSNTPMQVRLSNLTGRSATISWVTDSLDKGVVLYQEGSQPPSASLFSRGDADRAYDDRDYARAYLKAAESYGEEASKQSSSDYAIQVESTLAEDLNVDKLSRYYVHHVTLTDLEPNTQYSFVVGNGVNWWDVSEADQTMILGDAEVLSSSTFSTLDDPSSVPPPNPAYGRITQFIDNGDGGLYEGLGDTLVYALATKKSQSTGTLIQSSVTNSDGGWVIDKSNFRESSTGLLSAGYNKGLDTIKLWSYHREFGMQSSALLWGTQDAPAVDLYYSSSSSDVKGVYIEPSVRSTGPSFLSRLLASSVRAEVLDEYGNPITPNDCTGKDCGSGSCFTGPNAYDGGYGCNCSDGTKLGPSPSPGKCVAPATPQPATTSDDCKDKDCGSNGRCDTGPNPNDGGWACVCTMHHPSTGVEYSETFGPNPNPKSCSGDPNPNGTVFTSPPDNVENPEEWVAPSTPSAQCSDAGGAPLWSSCPSDPNRACRCYANGVDMGVSGLSSNDCGGDQNAPAGCSYQTSLGACRIPEEYVATECPDYEYIEGEDGTTLVVISGTPSGCKCVANDGSLQTPSGNLTYSDCMSKYNSVEFQTSCGFPPYEEESIEAIEVNEGPEQASLLPDLGSKLASLLSFRASAQSDSPLVYRDPSQNHVVYFAASGMFDINLGDYIAEGVLLEEGQKYLFYLEINGVDGYQEGEDEIVALDGLVVDVAQLSATFPVELKRGINIVSLPFLPTSDGVDSLTAYDLMELANDSIRSIKAVSYFSDGRWDAGVVHETTNPTDIRGNDFPLTFGKGYIIVAERDMLGENALMMPGYAIESSVPVAFSPGWNLIGLHGYSQSFTAKSLLTSIGASGQLGADNVTYWPTSKGRYESFQYDGTTEFGFDYPILEELGYFVRVNSFEPSTTGVDYVIWQPGQ